MTIPAIWNENWTAALVNHLWQSTVVVAIAWLLTLALCRNHAQVRYWVWMAASLKFLLPFSLLITAGEWLRSLMATSTVARPDFANVMEEMAQPFPRAQFVDATTHPTAVHHANWLPVVLMAAWICGVLLVAVRFGRGWLRVYAAKRVALPLALAADFPMLSSPTLIEPGILGIFRPVLLMPAGIVERLSHEQLQAIIAHEMCHVRRRDNLTFALHMITEALFWFHPAVWWIGARLVEERELACDEAVVEKGGAAQAYAEGILNVCKFYVESPVECVAGVTGADLKKRIVRIMTQQVASKLTLGGRLLLCGAGLAAIAVPVAFGMVRLTEVGVHGQAAGAAAKLPEFEVATIKPSKPGAQGSTFEFAHGEGLKVTNGTLKAIIEMAYDVRDFQITGGPAWINSQLFDIVAKSASSDSGSQADNSPESIHETRLRLQALLALRFQLGVHSETKELPIYVLTVGKNGPRMTEDMATDTPGNSPVGINAGCGQMAGTRTSMANLAYKLSRQLYRPVIDHTGLTGRYDFQLSYSPDAGPCSATASSDNPDSRVSSPDGPSLFTALQEQIGLKLESQKGPTEVLVIDHVEQPTPN